MRLLAESGYGPDNPVEVKVLISTSGSGQMQPLAMNEYIQQNLAEVGIALDFEVLAWESLFPNWRRGAEDPSSRGAHATNITSAGSIRSPPSIASCIRAWRRPTASTGATWTTPSTTACSMRHG